MKKVLIIFLSIFILFPFSSCGWETHKSTVSAETENTATEEHASETENIATEEHASETKEYEGPYYRIYKEPKPAVLGYDIFNKKGEIVRSSSEWRPLTIQMVNDSILEIRIGMGTGLQQCQYYDVENDLFSEEYVYVVARADRLMAYIEFSEEGSSMENRKIAVRDMFDQDRFYKEFPLDFSRVDTPVLKASFSDDKKSLSVVYLSGEQLTETAVILDLT